MTIVEDSFGICPICNKPTFGISSGDLCGCTNVKKEADYPKIKPYQPHEQIIQITGARKTVFVLTNLGNVYWLSEHSEWLRIDPPIFGG